MTFFNKIQTKKQWGEEMAWGSFEQREKRAILSGSELRLEFAHTDQTSESKLAPQNCFQRENSLKHPVYSNSLIAMCCTCSSRSSTFLCHPSLAAIISSSFCWDSWVSAACLSASYSSVNSSLNKRTSSLQNDNVGAKHHISYFLPLHGSINCIMFSLHLCKNYYL